MPGAIWLTESSITDKFASRLSRKQCGKACWDHAVKKAKKDNFMTIKLNLANGDNGISGWKGLGWGRDCWSPPTPHPDSQKPWQNLMWNNRENGDEIQDQITGLGIQVIYILTWVPAIWRIVYIYLSAQSGTTKEQTTEWQTLMRQDVLFYQLVQENAASNPTCELRINGRRIFFHVISWWNFDWWACGISRWP